MKLLRYLIAVSLLVGLGFKADGPVKKYPKVKLQDVAELASILKDPKKPDPVVLNVGSLRTLIKGAIPAGPASTEEGLLSFKAQLMNYKKTQPIVIYCGCCALEHCPNVSPALDYANDEGYKNVKILNIQKSLKAEWEDKGYPMK